MAAVAKSTKECEVLLAQVNAAAAWAQVRSQEGTCLQQGVFSGGMRRGGEGQGMTPCAEGLLRPCAPGCIPCCPVLMQSNLAVYQHKEAEARGAVAAKQGELQAFRVAALKTALDAAPAPAAAGGAVPPIEQLSLI